MPERRTYLLVDGENIDATLGSNVLQRRPAPEERPRWDRILGHVRDAWGQEVTALFFLNASSGTLPGPFIQALTGLGYRAVPLAGPSDVKVVDVAVQRTLEAIVPRAADVVLASHDADFAPQLRELLATDGRRVGVAGFTESFSHQYFEMRSAGLTMVDLEYDAGAFNIRLPRVRIIPIESFDPAEFL